MKSPDQRAEGAEASTAHRLPLTAYPADPERRFGGVARLYGGAALARFQASHVCVIGIGGVGSWAAEALARSAIGAITLIDLDHVAESNINRQVHALDPELGKAKVEAMKARILGINPDCAVTCIEDFVTPDNLEETLGRGFDFVLDAMDGVKAKAALIAFCRERNISLVTVGGAGGQRDPTRIEVRDLARTEQEPLLARVRKLLRQKYGFPRSLKRKFDIEAVFSMEPTALPAGEGAACELDEHEPGDTPGITGLNCAGYGSSVCVTASFGFVAASRVLEALAKSAES
ncbi:MAG: tRNA cyclic N6-threonylcarbamoyladenosine(37) synthase TcdA [Rhodocyclaceae bacterium]|nr:tRNA cyclic N6-threonylcarbamoyladenosine(37) synthase TcdA [Rhodocyclaceae bacterium]